MVTVTAEAAGSSPVASAILILIALMQTCWHLDADWSWLGFATEWQQTRTVTTIQVVRGISVHLALLLLN